ncbi:hypothetical protein Vi05172_g8496 [Venturia inaequalis]|nr:hypothetical protein Vi05172_g8496 [Venturia inaequalis]
MNIHALEILRPLGKLEQFSSARHHLGFYNNVGVSAHYTAPQKQKACDSSIRNHVFRAVAIVIQEHAILSAIPIDEDTPSPYFARLPTIDLSRAVSFVTRVDASETGGDGELDALLEREHNTNFKADYGSLPFWRLVIVQMVGVFTEFTACFIFHHALADGVSGLVFHKSLQAALNKFDRTSKSMSQTIITSPNIPLLPSLETLHPLPIPPRSETPVPPTLEEWTGQKIALPCITRFKHLSISAPKSKAFLTVCKQNNTTLTSALSALIATHLFALLPQTTQTLTCVIPR